ncbi:MAG: response regulator transcription factor [Phycisphaerae bacterium]|jgi:NarL family two-component system response regulator LiaR
MNPIKILIADDHAMFASTLSGWLRGQTDIEVLGIAASAEEAINQAVDLQPDVVLMDIDMPGLACFAAARILSDRCPDCAVIFVSAYTHDHYIEQALAAEAAGYVTKSEPPESVAAAIRAVVSGGAYFSPEVQSRIIVDDSGARLAESARTRLSLLTPRELDILRYIARGLTKRQIADTLSVAVKTVDSHTANLMLKLDIHDRVGLARFAIREGLAEA